MLDSVGDKRMGLVVSGVNA